ncbi:cell division protein FtsA [Chloroflexota bacterium]
MKRTRIGAIDVGTTKVCTIMADIESASGPRILGVGIAPSHGLQKGMVADVNEAREAIRESIRRAEQIAGYKLESAYIGITGRHISSVNNKGVIAITRNDQLVRPQDLKRVLEVARSIKVPDEQKVLHIIPRTYAIDGQEGIRNPIGMHGFRLDAETHIITAAVTSIQNLTKCIRSLGVEIDDLVMEPLASAEAVLSEEEKQDGVILADIGGGTTDIAIFKGDTIYHTSVLPVAGYQVTRDISIGMGLSFDLAEEMKRKYADVKPNDDNGEDDRNITADGHSVSYRDLSEIVRIRVEELLRLIVLELPHDDSANLVPAGVVLTGGSSNLPGIAELGSEVTQLPMRVGTPGNFYGVSDTLCNPAYATGVGLILWKMRNQGAQTQISQSSLHRIISRFFRLFR